MHEWDSVYVVPFVTLEILAMDFWDDPNIAVMVVIIMMVVVIISHLWVTKKEMIW